MADSVIRMARVVSAMALFAACWSPGAQAAGYSISSLNTPVANFVATGDTVRINITGPSSGLILRSALMLNGHNVTSALLPDGTPGSLTGTVPGLQVGDNTLQLFTSKTSQIPVAQLKVTRAMTPSFACSSLTGVAGLLPVPATAVTSATLTAATPTVPEHCNVIGTINAGRVGYESSPGAPVARYTYTINWQSRLPTNWNGRFYMPGGGGTDGSVPGTTGNLNLGYATAANDSGHNNGINNDSLAGGSASFGSDYLARVDFAYNAIDVTTQTAKALVNHYYAQGPTYSYFQGCSMGGREAMMVAQRFPNYFNGVVAGDPAFRITKVGVWASYEAHQLAALATSMGLISGFGVPFANNTFTDRDLQLISKAVLTACDSLDGLVDGMVGNSQACTTALVTPQLNALQCPGAKTTACLTGGQITAVANIYDKGAPDSNGVPQYAPWMWDAGIAGCTSAADCNITGTGINGGWRLWNLGFFNPTFAPNVTNAANGAFNFASLGGGAIPLLFATPPVLPSPTANDALAKFSMTTDFDALAQSIFGTSALFPVSNTTLLNMDDSKLAFKNSGGKLIVWAGQTGGPFSPQDLVNWYAETNTSHGGTAQDYTPTQSFARLFMVPGMNHCGGGPATSTFDTLAPVVNWVENGVPPASIPATAPAVGTPFPGRTRPLCPYPTYARYNGSGNINVASSFSCQQ